MTFSIRTALLFFAIALGTLSCRCDAPRAVGGGGAAFTKCAGGSHDGQRTEVSLPPLRLIRDGRTLEIKGPDQPMVTLGLLSGLNEPDATTLSHIRFFLEQFKGAEVQMILVAGGVGVSEADNRTILTALSEAPIPILVSPGAEENFGALRKVIRELNAHHPQLIDMTLVRRVLLRHVSVLSLPGYFQPYYLEAGAQGCAYDKGDLSLLRSLVDKEHTHLLLSASPPRGVGPEAVDIGRGNVNIGDPALASALAESGIRFGLFGHVHEAAGNATQDDGKTPAAPGLWHDSLYLQAGAADAVPVSTVGGGMMAGVGHVVEFSGDRARYRRIAVP